MALGSFVAIKQTNIRRLLAYSSIAHMGFALIALSSPLSSSAVQSLLIYMLIYVVTNLGVFACIISLETSEGETISKIDDLSGLSRRYPFIAFSMTMLMFSFAGIPPLAGFFAKLYVFKAVIEQSMYFLAIVGLLSTVIAAFYYLKIIKIIYFDEAKEKYDLDHSIWLRLSLTLSTLLILLYFIYPSKLIEIVSKINII